MTWSLRARAALLVLTAILPIAAGIARAYEALRGPRPHVCVCPLDAEGHCLCPECIRLGVHDHAHDDEADDVARIAPGPEIASACSPAPGDDLPPIVLDAAIPPRIDHLVAPRCDARIVRALAPRWRARVLEPSVPPPRLG